MEADLQDTYRVHLSSLFTGALSFRRLLVLMSQLPPTSRVARARDERATWTLSQYLAAQAADNAALVADEVALLRWVYASANSKRGKRPKRPEPYPRLPRPGQPQQPAAPRRRRPRDAARAIAARRAGER